jgi:hypothetical protein
MNHFSLLFITLLIEFLLIGVIIMLIKLISPYLSNYFSTKRQKFIRKDSTRTANG